MNTSLKFMLFVIAVLLFAIIQVLIFKKPSKNGDFKTPAHSNWSEITIDSVHVKGHDLWIITEYSHKYLIHSPNCCK